MGIGSWLDRRLPKGQMANARKTLVGLGITAENDPAYYVAVAQNIPEQLQQFSSGEGLTSEAHLAKVLGWFRSLNSEELFDRSYSLLKTSKHYEKVFPAKAQAMALVAHWICMMSIAKGSVSEVRDDADDLAYVYAEAIGDMLKSVDASSVIS